MISWVVSTKGVLTGLTSASSSESAADSELSFSSEFFEYTSQNTSAITTSYFSQSAAQVFSDGSQFEGSFSNSGSSLLSTMQAQTSKTETISTTKASTFATTSQIQAWTTSNDENEIIEFYQTSSTTNTWSVSSQSTISTRDTTTTTNGTMIASATALALRAKIESPDAEIIYYASAALSWNGLTAAKNTAQTATQTTLANIYSTINAAQNNIQVTADSGGFQNEVSIPSFSWSNQSSTYSLQLVTSKTISTQTTVVTNSTILPNETASASTQKTTTSTTSFSFNLWTSNSGSISGQDSTTTTFRQLTISSVSGGLSWLGNVSWNVARTTTASRAVTTSTTAGYIRTFAYTFGGSGMTAGQIIALLLPPQVTTAIAQNATQSKFVPVFAQISDSKGQWFTVNESTFSSASYASVSRSLGKTIFPLSIEGESYGKSQLTYKPTSASLPLTATLGVAGQSTTTAIGPVIGIVGGFPNSGETFAYGVGAAGVYKNRIGGDTTSFDAGATTFSQSRPASFFEPITALVPVVGTGTTAVFPLYWAVPRNSTALPPAMPPDA